MFLLVLVISVSTSATNGGLQFELTPCIDRRCKKFGLSRKVYSARIRDLPTKDLAKVNLWRELELALKNAVGAVICYNGEDDRVMINMSSNRLHHSYQSPPVTVSQWREDHHQARLVLEKITEVLNSNESFEIDDTFHIEVTTVEMPPPGSGRLKTAGVDVESLLRKKKSVVFINNKDEICCARALVVARAKVDGDARYNDIKKGRSIQGELARHLHAQAGVSEGPCGLEEIEKFQTFLTN